MICSVTCLTKTPTTVLLPYSAPASWPHGPSSNTPQPLQPPHRELAASPAQKAVPPNNDMIHSHTFLVSLQILNSSFWLLNHSLITRNISYAVDTVGEYRDEHNKASALKKLLTMTGAWAFQEVFWGEVAPTLNPEGKVEVSSWEWGW